MKKKIWQLSVLLCAGMMMAAPAFAGFQWIPPSPNLTSNTYMPPPAPPESQILMPDIEDQIAEPAPVPAMEEEMESTEHTPPSAPVAPKALFAPEKDVIEKIRAQEAAYNDARAFKKKRLKIDPTPLIKKKPTAKIEKPVTPAAPKPITEQSTNGFGTDLPLALAMRQIIPAHYAFAFGDKVDPGLRVSWDGQGKNWDVALANMLTSYGMQAELKGSTVKVSQNEQAPLPAVQEETPDQTPRRAVIVTPPETESINTTPAADPISLLPMP